MEEKRCGLTREVLNVKSFLSPNSKRNYENSNQAPTEVMD